MNRTHIEPLTVLKDNSPKPGWVRSQKCITILKIIFTYSIIAKDFCKLHVSSKEETIATALKDRID